MSNPRVWRTIRLGAVAVGMAVTLQALPAAAVVEFPKVITTVDNIQVAYDEPDGSEQPLPQVVSWRTTGEVEADLVTHVPEETLGQTRVVSRDALGEDVPADYPVTVRGIWSTPWCSASSSAADWLHASDWVSRGRSWAGIRGTEIDLTGYRPRQAPDGSKLQWAELGVGGFNRFPPQEPSPGGRLVGRDFGRAVHDLTWFDPSESCFVGGVRRVDQNFAFGISAIDAVDGDVSVSAGDELPTLHTELAGDHVDDLRGLAVLWATGIPGVAVEVDVTVLADADGRNPVLEIQPHASTAGTWKQSRRSRQGTDWQLRFYTFSWTETIDFGNQQMGSIQMHPGERALVVGMQDDREERQDLRADAFSELRVGTSETTLAPLAESTPFPDLNSCGGHIDAPQDGFEVVAPDDPGDPGDPASMRSAGVGDPSLAPAIPPGWLGFDLAGGPGDAYTLEDLTLNGTTFGAGALPYVSVDGGPPRKLTADLAVEGPIFYERQYPMAYAGTSDGINWVTLMLATVYRVDDVDLTLYWILHGKVIGDSQGVGGAACATVLVSEAMSPQPRDVELVWFVRANLRGAQRTYFRQYRLDAEYPTGGYPTIATEKSWDRGVPNGWLLDNYNLFGIRDTEDPGQRWMFQHWQGSGGITTLTRFKGTVAPNPTSEVDGENIAGADIGLYLTSELEGVKRWSHQPFLVFPCGPCGFF